MLLVVDFKVSFHVLILKVGLLFLLSEPSGACNNSHFTDKGRQPPMFPPYFSTLTSPPHPLPATPVEKCHDLREREREDLFWFTVPVDDI